jgi:hypothetical protein
MITFTNIIFYIFYNAEKAASNSSGLPSQTRPLQVNLTRELASLRALFSPLPSLPIHGRSQFEEYSEEALS